MRKFIFCYLAAILASGCGTPKKIENFERGGMGATISINDEKGMDIETTVVQLEESADTLTVRGLNGEKLFLMKSIVDSLGNSFGSETLSGVVISAKFKHVAERGGKIDLGFEIKVPKELQDLSWRLRFKPKMEILDDTVDMEDLYITGIDYLNKHLASIITDSTRLRHQRLIDIFIARGNGAKLSREEIISHYERGYKILKNNKYIEKTTDLNAIKLDSVITTIEEIRYHYTKTIDNRPNAKKLKIFLEGDIIKDGEIIHTFPTDKGITFYISNLTYFADTDTIHPSRTYTEGITALKEKNYHKAANLLLPYRDINSAVACMSLGNNYQAEEILTSLPVSAKRDYMLAIIYAQQGDERRAIQSYIDSVEKDRNFTFRANLDPEISQLIKKYNINL